MATLNPENTRKRDELVAAGCAVEIHADHGKFFCHIGPPNNELPPVYKDTADEAFETAYSNHTQRTGRLGG